LVAGESAGAELGVDASAGAEGAESADLEVKSPLQRHSKTGKSRHIVLSAIASILCFALTAVPTMFGLMYWDIHSHLNQLSTNLLKDRPPVDPAAGASVNILIMGIDNREGENQGISGGGDANENSDTNVLVHISSDRKRADIISIPRDSMVALPSCNTTKGATDPQDLAMFNAAYATGFNLGNDVSSGASCAVSTFEKNTNIRLDGYAVLDFHGFLTMIDALGGVEVNIQQEIFSPHAGGLHLMPGPQILNGWQATEYARARTGEGLGDGSDIGRIDRQQGLMIDLMKTALKKNILTDTVELYKFAKASAGSVDTTYSTTDLMGIAYSLKDVSLSNIDLATVPWMLWPEDPNRIIWSDDANTLWNEIKKDKKITVNGVKTINENVTQ
jgi:LCP family protein required for cell wall assembly